MALPGHWYGEKNHRYWMDTTTAVAVSLKAVSHLECEGSGGFHIALVIAQGFDGRVAAGPLAIPRAGWRWVYQVYGQRADKTDGARHAVVVCQPVIEVVDKILLLGCEAEMVFQVSLEIGLNVIGLLFNLVFRHRGEVFPEVLHALWC